MKEILKTAWQMYLIGASIGFISVVLWIAAVLREDYKSKRNNPTFDSINEPAGGKRITV